MSKVLAVGSVNMDLVIQTARFPQPGETRPGFGFASIPGGKGANQAAAAAKLGCTVRMLGAVGEDAQGAQLRAHLQACGVETQWLLTRSGSSGVAVITVSNGENMILLDAGANGKLTPEDMSAHADLFRWADRVIVQFEVPMETVIRAAELARTAGAEVMVNPAPFREIPEALLGNIDWLILNETEAAAMAGKPAGTTEEAVVCMEEIERRFAGRVIVTLGKAGCLYRADDGIRRIPAFPVTAVDTTAAGDCFIGALCAVLDEAEDIEEALRFASAASAITVSRMGAGCSIPSRAEAEAFLKDK